MLKELLKQLDISQGTKHEDAVKAVMDEVRKIDDELKHQLSENPQSYEEGMCSTEAIMHGICQEIKNFQEGSSVLHAAKNTLTGEKTPEVSKFFEWADKEQIELNKTERNPNQLRALYMSCLNEAVKIRKAMRIAPKDSDPNMDTFISILQKGCFDENILISILERYVMPKHTTLESETTKPIEIMGGIEFLNHLTILINQLDGPITGAESTLLLLDGNVRSYMGNEWVKQALENQTTNICLMSANADKDIPSGNTIIKGQTAKRIKEILKDSPNIIHVHSLDDDVVPRMTIQRIIKKHFILLEKEGNCRVYEDPITFFNSVFGMKLESFIPLFIDAISNHKQHQEGETGVFNGTGLSKSCQSDDGAYISEIPVTDKRVLVLNSTSGGVKLKLCYKEDPSQ